MNTITLEQLVDRARNAYFEGHGRFERFENLHPIVKEDWYRVVTVVIQGSLDLPEQVFKDIANIEDKDILATEGITEEDIKVAAKEGAAEAIDEHVKKQSQQP